MLKPFKLTDKQNQALGILGSIAMFVMLFGGSRSGKTFLAVRAVIIRALASDNSRHAILRFRFNHVKASIVHDTFPKVMRLCFPDIKFHLDKTDWFVQFENGAQIWFGGLDDKERTEKILGQEYATIYLNETSQISYDSYLMCVTRLAQMVLCQTTGKPLTLKFLLDCNPPSRGHWTYKLFIQKIEPRSKRPAKNPNNYNYIQMNPEDNKENLSEAYLQTLRDMPAYMRKRFYEGEFADESENALWPYDVIERNQVDSAPEFLRKIVSVDPSGAGDTDNAGNDAIGICVCGLGVDGFGYLIEDITLKAGPAKWGKVATNAYTRHACDKIIGETNFGGEMVKFVVRTALPNVPFKKVTASRGKVIRAEPIAALTDQDKIKFLGSFPDLEDELQSFTTSGYLGENSPNRADAFIWGMTELFPGITEIHEEEDEEEDDDDRYSHGSHGWMT